MVLPGEALLMDNPRVMHVREDYSDFQRRSSRVFMIVGGRRGLRLPRGDGHHREMAPDRNMKGVIPLGKESGM
jgi:hypothetical protein